ncbi:hypothetical protein [Nannocystis pusilla]|uniref:Myxococcus cysteine-rich repeat-containing protein n=1 Tax=Nannocystis pusilla TaxID=889268 RepID=A0ABS7TUR1_9BACT|nr:hypothetical protein [Nannocystis pusilla]MBZ5711998.1 hypothetical protein [Nannocystis pusilla]
MNEAPAAPSTTTAESGTSEATAEPTSVTDGTTGTPTSTGGTGDVPTTSGTSGTTDLGPYCGDGMIDPGEGCDEGAANADDSSCTHQCTLAVCGDGLVRHSVEECDLGDGNSSGYGGCNECQWGPRCGDGLLDEGHEVCDLGDLNGTGVGEGEQAPCRSTCTWQGRLVFVTSQAYSGALGGLDGADIRCRERAKAVGLANANTFRAWLSDALHSPNTRFQQIELQDAPYILGNGRVVAADFSELVDDGPRTGIAIDETGTMVTDAFVWTNTSGLGNVLHPVDHCDAWTSSSEQFGAMAGVNALATEEGPAWEAWRADRQWTVLLTLACNFESRLYCFEDGYVLED